MNKKAQGLSLNTIIVAAIVLIVLIVLWAIFTGKMGSFSQGLTGTTEGDAACKDICTATWIYTAGTMITNTADYTTCGSGTAQGSVNDAGTQKACCCS